MGKTDTTTVPQAIDWPRVLEARAAVLRNAPDASVETLLLDTSNLGSVRAAAATVRGRAGLHGLLLNAGIVHPPRHRQTTADGHEIVFATNALGHYALAGELLLPLAGGNLAALLEADAEQRFRRLVPVDQNATRVDDHDRHRVACGIDGASRHASNGSRQ